MLINSILPPSASPQAPASKQPFALESIHEKNIKKSTLLSEKMVKPSYGVQILLPLFLSCTAYNIVRRAIGEAAPALIETGFFERSDYAMINTVSFILYGLSKFFTSHLVKGNYFLLYSWISTVVCVLTFLCGITCSAVYPSFHLFFVLWSTNYIFIGSLWPIICIIIKQWIPDHCSGLFV